MTDAEVAKLVAVIRDRVLWYLRRLGKLPAAGEEAATADAADGGAELLVELAAASVQGRAALGERAGERDQRVGRGMRNEPFSKGPLCAEVEGFSLHVSRGVRAGGRDSSVGGAEGRIAGGGRWGCRFRTGRCCGRRRCAETCYGSSADPTVAFGS